jgi:hypothetical protein
MKAPGFFTRGVVFELPHPTVPLRLILIVHAVIEFGLQLLRENPPGDFELCTADEDAISFRLHWIIANRIHKSKEVPGFDKRLFGKPQREPKMTNFDGKHPDKMPDLVFFLNRDSLPVLPSHDALVAECKPVDKSHPVGGVYCNKGLKRFIIGDYAWPMQEALMVGYVRDARCIATNLLPTMHQQKNELAMIEELKPVGKSLFTETERTDCLHVSVHARSFSWPDDRGKACSISIYHSWHPCS